MTTHEDSSAVLHSSMKIQHIENLHERSKDRDMSQSTRVRNRFVDDIHAKPTILPRYYLLRSLAYYKRI